jgi:hypothetical protein
MLIMRRLLMLRVVGEELCGWEVGGKVKSFKQIDGD